MPRLQTELGLLHDEAKKIGIQQVSPITATNVQDAIVQVATSGGSSPPAIVPTSISIAQSPYTIQDSDYLIYVDTSGGAVTLQTKASATRSGKDVTIKDVTGNAAANNISILRTAAETIDGLTTYPMASDFGSVTLSPKTANGYAVTK